MKPNQSKRLNHTTWIEKWRPQSIEDTILPENLIKLFKKFIKRGEVPSLLFYSSSPGVGKTTIAKALVEECDTDYLYINVSKERGIDILRDQIDKFASSISLMGGEDKKKIVILDEFDGATSNLQDALRASIEEFETVCRFILTCNYVTKIKDPIKSRCQEVDFNFMDKETQAKLKPKICVRLCEILKAEGIEYKGTTIFNLVNAFYPDIRKMIGLLQQYSDMNGIIDDNIFNYSKIDDEFYDLILNKKLTEARKFIIERSYNYDEMYRALFDNLIPKLESNKRAQAILIIAEYMYRNGFVVDKEINFTACMLEIIGVL